MSTGTWFCSYLIGSHQKDDWKLWGKGAFIGYQLCCRAVKAYSGGLSQVLIGGRLSPGSFSFLREQYPKFSIPCLPWGSGSGTRWGLLFLASILTSVGPGVHKFKVSSEMSMWKERWYMWPRYKRWGVPRDLNTEYRLWATPVFSQDRSRVCRPTGFQAPCPPDFLCPAGFVTILRLLSTLQSLVEIFCCCLLCWSFGPVWLFSLYLVNLWKEDKTDAHDQCSMFKQNSYHSLF